MWRVQTDALEMSDPHGQILQNADDLFSEIYTIIMAILLCVALLILVLSIVRILVPWIKDRQSDIMNIQAIVLSKRSNEDVFSDIRTVTINTHTYYYVTFLIKGGIQMEFRVPGEEYGMLAKGDSGKLTFQGRSYLGFERTID